MAVKILKGDSNIKEMPIQYADKFTKKYNPKIADELGIDKAMLEEKGYIAIEMAE